MQFLFSRVIHCFPCNFTADGKHNLIIKVFKVLAVRKKRAEGLPMGSQVAFIQSPSPTGPRDGCT